MKRQKFLSMALLAGTFMAITPVWGADSPTDRIPDTSKPGTASRPGTPDGSNATDRMGNMNKGMMGSQNVKSVQEALRDKGFDPGPIDGVMGRRTSAALRSFQQSKNLKATGQLDADTSQQLGVGQGSGAMNKSGSIDKSGMDKSKMDKSGADKK
jgi:peptidoglycan hydrolase-like protein with peptidoglycan-binding domain